MLVFKVKGRFILPTGEASEGQVIPHWLEPTLREEVQEFEAADVMSRERLVHLLKELFATNQVDGAGEVANNGPGEPVYRGYVDDPRNTDNAWIETAVVHCHCNRELGGLLALEGEQSVPDRAKRGNDRKSSVEPCNEEQERKNSNVGIALNESPMGARVTDSPMALRTSSAPLHSTRNLQNGSPTALRSGLGTAANLLAAATGGQSSKHLLKRDPTADKLDVDMLKFDSKVRRNLRTACKAARWIDLSDVEKYCDLTPTMVSVCASHTPLPCSLQSRATAHHRKSVCGP